MLFALTLLLKAKNLILKKLMKVLDSVKVGVKSVNSGDNGKIGKINE